MGSKGLKRALTGVSWHVLARRRKIEENEEGKKEKKTLDKEALCERLKTIRATGLMKVTSVHFKN